MTEEEIRKNERQRIGKILANLRAEKELSLSGLAELSGVGRSHIVRIEKGSHSTGVDILTKLADALDVELTFIAK